MAALLVGVDFLDELSGVAFVGAPEIASEYRLGYAGLAFILFTAPRLAGLLLEPPLFLLADRRSRRPFVLGGLTCLGLALCLAAISWSVSVLALALILAAVASGAGVGLAQATLMDAVPDRRELWMARWTLMGLLGDLAAPALLALLANLALGWRGALATVGALLLLYVVALAPQHFPAPSTPDAAPPPVGQAIAGALRNRRLVLWLLAVALCGLLDEVLVAFAALRATETLTAGIGGRGVVIAGLSAGMLVGLAATERLLSRVEPLRLLRGAGLACAAAYALWLAAPSLGFSAGLLFLVGFFAAPLYPIAKAQAYRALPGQSGMVNAVAHVFAPLDLAMPLVLGVVADRAGLTAALALLGAQPLGLALIAWSQARPDRART